MVLPIQHMVVVEQHPSHHSSILDGPKNIRIHHWQFFLPYVGQASLDVSTKPQELITLLLGVDDH
jgi:hypothetical protein